ncbi:MAG: iron ABC transporter substrate-binding protein [Hyphomicrobiales bacterium]|nr:MAG: iron ABC transporter substrate-binding protein [Hyphomicrobiales bacterium]
MKNNLFKTSVAAFVAMSISQFTPVFAEAFTINTAQGEVTIAKIPEKIAAFDVAVIDNLDALGIKPAGILNNLYVDYLDHVANSGAVDVGSFFEPNFEAVSALAPDLSIVATRSASQLEKLSEISQTIDLTVDWKNMLESSIEIFNTTAVIVGKTEQADKIVAKLRASVEELRGIVKDKGKALIVMTIGPKMSTYGPSSRFGWLHDDLGIEAAVNDKDAPVHGSTITHEFILNANPDWLIIIDRDLAVSGEAVAGDTLNNELIAKTTAWKKDQVIYINPASFYISGNGIQSVQASVNELITAFSK